MNHTYTYDYAQIHPIPPLPGLLGIRRPDDLLPSRRRLLLQDEALLPSAGHKLIYYYGPAGNTNGSGDVTIDLCSSINDGYSVSYDGIDRREANGAGVVYAALRFLPLGSGETDDITFTVTGTDDKTYTATKTSPVGGFQNSKYYTSTIAVTEVVEP